MEGEKPKEPFMRWESARIYGLLAVGLAVFLAVTGSSVVEAVGATVIAFAAMFVVAWLIGKVGS
jgi:hypothetical protein